ncbi:HNH endonuclease [Gorillibacterium sp. sgz5001074]|uniref:HNH endonuclease n=1 Tax=Gorillibacterium sp. sgz5001074 TaxID=3446695 RepID=UPI003F67EE11
MADRAWRPCNKHGCNTLTRSRYCDSHQKEHHLQYDRNRGSSSERGYGSRWRKYREDFLKKHPLCKTCKDSGVLSTADVVDHIIPHRGDQDLFWNPENHQGLCFICHSRKTAKEDGGFGNKSQR